MLTEDWYSSTVKWGASGTEDEQAAWESKGFTAMDALPWIANGFSAQVAAICREMTLPISFANHYRSLARLSILHGHTPDQSCKLLRTIMEETK